LWDEHKLRVFENKVLRKILESKDDVNRLYKIVHSEESKGLYRSPNVQKALGCRRFTIGRTCGENEEKKGRM
jgi:hypothetical protein